MKLSPMAKYKIVFYFVTFWLSLPLVVTLILAIFNPLWFRDGFFRWAEHSVNRLARWRNYRQYALYLGCDPEYWHTLKG